MDRSWLSFHEEGQSREISKIRKEQRRRSRYEKVYRFKHSKDVALENILERAES